MQNHCILFFNTFVRLFANVNCLSAPINPEPSPSDRSISSRPVRLRHSICININWQRAVITTISKMATCTEKGGIIKPIDHSTVHRICSGQVVLTLAVAVKELVENSLDSGASTIEVRLKGKRRCLLTTCCVLNSCLLSVEFGSESVEVNDDGYGITQDNFENLCLKHYTSKIEEFEDLLNVQTFGFRGEALSSLCALSTLSVTTCEKGSKIGWKLEYDHHGKLIKQIQYSRQVKNSYLFSCL